MKPFPENLDKVIHERARLGIMASLAARGKMSFVEIKATLQMSDGNLSVHARVLEENGYLKIVKKFAGRKPLTTLSLTRKGREAFRNYVDQLEQVILLGKRKE